MIVPSIPEFLQDKIRASDSIGLAGKKILTKEFVELVSHEAGTKSGVDIEELHRMRVCTRRMRTCFRIWDPVYDDDHVRSLCAAIRSTAHVLGKVRDIDTFLESLSANVSKFPEELQSAVKRLMEERKQTREVGLTNIRMELDGELYQQWKKDFLRFIEEESTRPQAKESLHFAGPRILNRCFNAVMKYKKKVMDATPKALHKLRIKCKEFRYITEFFQTAYDKRLQTTTEYAERLQDLLGEILDTERDLLLLETNIQELVPIVHAGENALHSLIDHMKERRKRGYEVFHEFWRISSVEEHENMIQYIITHAVK